MQFQLILAAILLTSLSGLPAFLFSSRSSLGQVVSTLFMAAGGGLGLTGLILAFGKAPQHLQLPWFLPLGQFSITLDSLNLIFLGLIFVIPVLSSIYGHGYWKQAEHPRNGRRLGLFMGLLTGSMGMVVISRDAVLFMISWEIMALSAYFSATVESDDPEVREAGWIYLIATHVGTMVLLAMFALLRARQGSFEIGTDFPIATDTAAGIFILAVIGFGFKAGLIPLHVWLPGAHANAPSHVSAVMSGVMLKMGIYGLLRILSLFDTPPAWWGIVLLVSGTLTGLAGIGFALFQTDIKRLLAYSSIENLGIITMGIGLALLGKTFGRTDLLLLGMGSSLLHVLNHGLFKSLMFFNAGGILHAAGTRNMEKLGGLGKSMPQSLFFFVLGSLALCAIPPLNGFVSEWLLYAGLFRTLDVIGAAALAAVALAGIGALAVAVFVKITGTIFLGEARSSIPAKTHDPSALMTIPMGLLAAACLAIAFFPLPVVKVMGSAAIHWAPRFLMEGTIEELMPLGRIGIFALALLLLAGLFFLILRSRGRRARTSPRETWDCGYAAPSSRMQYTGSSFSNPIRLLFPFLFISRRREPEIRKLFPGPSGFSEKVPDTALDLVLVPLFRKAADILLKIRVSQQGQTHLYVLYIFVITILLFVFGGLGGNS